jgi:hypothetical protein
MESCTHVSYFHFRLATFFPWHFQWLDLTTGILEIRQEPIWKSKPGNWLLNVRNRQAQRRQSRLVDPRSPLFYRWESLRFTKSKH